MKKSGKNQTTGTPGSPFATTTIDGKQLPNPPFPFTVDGKTVGDNTMPNRYHSYLP